MLLLALSLISTPFCQTYACAPAVLIRGESPAYISAFKLGVPGVTAKVFRYPEQARPTGRQVWAAPVLAATLDVWVTAKTDRRAVSRIVRDLVLTVGGPDERPELYEDCLQNARRSDLPAGFEHIVVRTAKLFVKCVYAKPGAQVIFSVGPVFGE